MERGALAGGGVDGERDEVGLGVVALADGAVLGRAGGVEVAEGGEAQAVGVGEGFEDVFHVELGLPVGVDRGLGHAFDERHLLGHAVGRAGGGEDELLHAAALHAAQQVERGGDVVEVILHRVGDALAHVGVGGEVHDQLDLLLFDDLADLGLVAEIDGVERDLVGHGGAVAEHEVIEHHRVVTGGEQLANTVGADVTGASDDKDVHR